MHVLVWGPKNKLWFKELRHGVKHSLKTYSYTWWALTAVCTECSQGLSAQRIPRAGASPDTVEGEEHPSKGLGFCNRMVHGGGWCGWRQSVWGRGGVRVRWPCREGGSCLGSGGQRSTKLWRASMASQKGQTLSCREMGNYCKVLGEK